MDKRAEIAALIAPLVPVLERLSKFDDYDDAVPRPGPPASALSIDGYESLAFPGKDMLAIKSIMPGGSAYEEILEWKSDVEEPDEVANAIVIANSDQPSNFDYLDCAACGDDGELGVVRWTPQGSLRFDNFRDYLEKWCLASALEGHIGL